MTLTICTVDDSQSIREMMTYTLKEAGFIVLEAEDGQKALEVLEKNTADVVITDLNMPNMDGLTLIKSLRAKPQYSGTPILMLTTESDAEKKVAGKAAGATGWIVKPFNPDNLITVIKKITGH